MASEKQPEVRKQEILKLLLEVCPGQHDILLQVILSYEGVIILDPINPRKHLLLVTFIEQCQSHPLGLWKEKRWDRGNCYLSQAQLWSCPHEVHLSLVFQGGGQKYSLKIILFENVMRVSKISYCTTWLQVPLRLWLRFIISLFHHPTYVFLTLGQKHFRNSKVLSYCKDPDYDPHQTFPYWESLPQLTGPCHHRHRSTKIWFWILKEFPWFYYIAATSLPHEDWLSYLNQSDNPWFWLSIGMKSPKWAEDSHSCMFGHILTVIPGCDRKHSVGK